MILPGEKSMEVTWLSGFEKYTKGFAVGFCQMSSFPSIDETFFQPFSVRKFAKWLSGGTMKYLSPMSSKFL